MAAAVGGATARIQPKKQTLEDAYSPPANFLEIDVGSAQTHGVGKKRYTDYEVKMKVGFKYDWASSSNFVATTHLHSIIPIRK